MTRLINGKAGLNRILKEKRPPIQVFCPTQHLLRKKKQVKRWSPWCNGSIRDCGSPFSLKKKRPSGSKETGYRNPLVGVRVSLVTHTSLFSDVMIRGVVKAGIPEWLKGQDADRVPLSIC